MNKPYDSQDFDAKYTYSGTDLGALWTMEATSFRLWAPTASSVKVKLYKGGTAGVEDSIGQLDMTADVNGTWTAKAEGDLNGTYYTYLVEVDGITEETCDPYARSTGVNGQRAMVLNLSSTNPPGWETDTDPHAGNPITDAVIYELHLRDLSMDESSGIRNRGKFLGLTETGTTTPDGIPTGLDHIKALGVTHIHLLPVFDFGFTDESLPEPQYNWGYDPVNFNVPEGSYATDPYHGEVRVKEMKQMVKALHDNGISVIMDVVYNHVFDGETFCFNRIVPGYFSRIHDGVWSNGSICGNDTASERSMVRKYIVDSVNYWADEYHIDGFRFDLVGLIDITTVNEIVKTVHETHPNVIFYGEGWTMETAMVRPNCDLAIQPNSPKTPGFAYFSDTIRDLLRGSIRDDSKPGYASGLLTPKQELAESFLGMPQWASEPYQCINYVSCHDNHTLFDRLALGTPGASEADRIRMNNLAAAFVFLSQGVPFLQAGEEMLRTKPDGNGGFDHNSYRSPDAVNALKWADLSKEAYQKTADYYRGLIAFRHAHPSLRLKTREEVRKAVHPIPLGARRGAAFLIQGSDCDIFVIFNAGKRSLRVPLPEGSWEVNICGGTSGTAPISHAEGFAHATPISATVLTRKK